MSVSTEDTTPGILIIEDEALVAQDVKLRLKQLGHRVVGLAHNARQALKKAEELQPGLLLCDIQLNDELDGIDVAEAITAQRDIPVIFLTAYSDTETVAKAKTLAPYGYVLKPIETPDLQITIEMALHKFSIEQELRETRELLSTALHCIGEALVFLDTQGRITNINPEARGLFGLGPEQFQGREWRDLLRLHAGEGGGSVGEFLQHALQSDAVTRLPPFTVVKADGSEILLDGIVGPTTSRGEPAGVVLILRELAEIHDPLDSLPSAAGAVGLDDGTVIPQGSDRSFVLLLISLDGYEQLASTLDDDERETLLEEVALQLNQAMRSSDLATHYGGAVFSASLPATSLDEASGIAEAILSNLSEARFLQGRVSLTVSIGIGHYQPAAGGDETESPLEIFRRANWALNLAKQSGGGRVALWGPSNHMDYIGNHDHQSGLLAADSGRDYRNMVLLWNTMNSFAETDDGQEPAVKIAAHFRKSFDLEMAGIFWQTGHGLQLVAADPPRDPGPLDAIGLRPAEIRKIQAVAAGTEPESGGEGADLFSQALPLYHEGLCRGVLYIRSGQGQNGLRKRDLTFISSLLEYASAPLARQMAEAPALPMETERQAEETSIYYQSEAMAAVMEHVKLVAPTDATVLITGESGTGKELVSREIHRLSERRDQPFVIVDCGAIVDGLIESELFGHVKGAFTGATSAKAGKLKEADGGTILLDEIGELAVDVQAKLLRMVQEKHFTAVGSNELQTVDTRIIAATNVDLEAGIKAGTFREDLYYRLNVFTIHLPPLRDRAEDILGMANHFVQHISRQYGKDIEGFSGEAARMLCNYHWPGNIRELRNRLIRAVILCQDRWLAPDVLDLPPGVTTPPDSSLAPASDPVDERAGGYENKGLAELESGLSQAFEQLVSMSLSDGELPPLGVWLEEDLINASLSIHQQVNLHAADALGMPESTLRRKIARYSSGIQTDRSDAWQRVTKQLPQWILATEHTGVNPRLRLQQLLLGQIVRQCHKQADGAALAGVSVPTYRRQMNELNA